MQDKDICPPLHISGRAEMESVLLAPELDLFPLYSALWNTEQLLWWLEKVMGGKVLGKLHGELSM